MINPGIPMLAPAPGHAPGTGANTGPYLRMLRAARSSTGRGTGQPFTSSARHLDAAASAFDRARDGYLMHRLTVIRPATATDPGQYESQTFPASQIRPGAYAEWLDHIWPAAACACPIRLHGRIRRVDPATGEITSDTDTGDLPDGTVYKACGNRRVTTCPGCAETYRSDAFQLIRVGLVGGKGIPATVAQHPAIFATFTAPSFGPVHSRPVRMHTCARRDRCRCKAEPCHARRDTPTCPHGRPAACFTRHRPDDPRLGQPLCPDCYDYTAHVVWNYAAGELWRRTKQHIERHLRSLARRRGIPSVRVPCGNGKYRRVSPVRVSHGKVAEYQARGAVHFHALFRLDGFDPKDTDRIAPPPPGITAADLEDAIRRAATVITWTTPPHPANPDGWLIGWGTELDVRAIATQGTGTVTDLAVASYLAKYATKGTEPAGHASARLTTDTVDRYADLNGTHPERLIHACWTLGTPPADKDLRDKYAESFGPGYSLLRRWAHMLGFGGHFLTKAHHYSVTLTALRQARITYRRTEDTGPEHGPVSRHRDPDTGAVLILNQLSYNATGWQTTGDALLANTAADQARKRRQSGREELASEYSRFAASQAA